MGLTSDDLADIKQLMQAVVNAALLEQDKRIDAKFAEQDKRINAKFMEQDEKLDEIMNAVGVDLAKHSATLDDYEGRIKRLEHA